MHIINNISNGAGNVDSKATNLEVRGVLKIKMKEKKIIRKQKHMKIKADNLTEYATIVEGKGI